MTKFSFILPLLLACSHDPAPDLPETVPTVGTPPPVIQPQTPPPDMALATPSRLLLPAALATVQGQAVPVGPLHDSLTGRACYLSETGLCVPVDTVRINPQTETAFVDVDCQRGAVRMPSVPTADLFDGTRVWTLITGLPSIPDGTAGVAQRDPATGACKPARVVMAGGWGFAAPQIAATVWAMVKGR